MAKGITPSFERAIVLLSGGLDSTVAAAWAAEQFAGVVALTVDYGQRAAMQEKRAAESVARKLGLRWVFVELPWLGELGGSALVSSSSRIPHIDAGSLDDATVTRETARAVWVPNRNGVLVAVAGAYADAWQYTHIVLGLNREEGATFPDNTLQFAEAATAMLALSTLVHPRVVGPTAEMTKAEIVRYGLELEAPLEMVWSCYGDGDEPCWQCESCRRLRRALEEAGVWSQYAHQYSAISPDEPGDKAEDGADG